MPDRMVREGARFSDRVEAVSAMAELMFWRMLTVPDDFGIYYADAAQLRSAIWPKNPRNIRITDVIRWRDELTQADMLAAFEVEGIRYVELMRFGQKLKRPRRRFPPRPGQPPADPRQEWIEFGRVEEKRRESPHSPPPAGGGIASPEEAKATRPARFRRAERLDTLNEERERLEDEMRAILRPGGCAYAVEPTDPQKQKRLAELRTGHAALLKRIEQRRAELAKENAA